MRRVTLGKKSREVVVGLELKRQQHKPALDVSFNISPVSVLLLVRCPFSKGSHLISKIMALSKATTVLVLVLGVAMRIDWSACQVMKGKVSCLDCNPKSELSGIIVSVKCEKARKMSMTKEDGSFETKVASNLNCKANIVGGPKQLYARRESMVVNISSNNSTPLSFYTVCPSARAKCGTIPKTTLIDLPLPPEWGLAPSSYYFPYIFPIIGIP